LKNLSKLLRAIDEEFGRCPEWRRLIDAARKELSQEWELRQAMASRSEIRKVDALTL
jgi:hypothetical protein